MLIYIPIPSEIQDEISQFSFGLPNMEWENDLILPVLEIKNSTKEHLEALKIFYYPAFSLEINGLNNAFNKEKSCKIFARIKEEKTLSQLRNTIYAHFKEHGLTCKKDRFRPSILLGCGDRVSDARLANYLTEYSQFKSQKFKISILKVTETKNGNSGLELYLLS